MAPEVLSGEDLSANKTLDIWAIGIILYMMVFGFHPFKSKDRDQTVQHIISSEVKFPSTVPVTSEFK